MARPVGSRRAGVAVLIVAALAGCGDDEESGGPAPAGTPATTVTAATPREPRALDRDAMSNARNLTLALETCFVEEQDYSACTGVESWDDVGDARVASATATTFTVVAQSESGNEFTVARSGGGSVTRTCVEPGRAGCPASGRW